MYKLILETLIIVDCLFKINFQQPLLARAQQALSQQLERVNYRLDTELAEKEEELQRIKKQRVEMGVELYGKQQDLAKTQIKLEKLCEDFNNHQTSRMESESGLDELREEHDNLAKDSKIQVKKLNQSQKELDDLNEKLSHIISYENEMKKEIESTKRRAYAAEEIMSELETSKQEQDLLIDHLNKQIHNFSSQTQVFQAQLAMQQQETLAAKDILREAMIEMQQIRGEKREYLNKWKASMIELTKRDDAINSATKHLKQLQESIKMKELEIIGYAKDISIEKDDFDKKNSIMTKIKIDYDYISNKLQQLIDSEKEYNEKLSNVKTQLQTADNTLTQAKHEKKQFQDTISILEKNYSKLIQEIHKVDEKIAQHANQQMTLQSGADCVSAESKKIVSTIHEHEFSIENFRNDIARLDLEIVNYENYIHSLQENLQNFIHELHEKEDIIEEYQIEFKKQIDSASKKTNVLDRLNRKYELLSLQNAKMAEADASVSSPLEHTISLLNKQIKKSEQICNDLQKEWITKQTLLVNLINSSEKQQENVTELSCRYTVLQEKRRRLELKCKEHSNSIKHITTQINELRLDITKLNKYISENEQVHNKLSDDYKNLKLNFETKLELEEEENQLIEKKIESLEAARNEIISSIKQLERQVLLWERKIELEHETQTALDPTYGQTEISDMKLEIHRMEIRLTQLKRKQEELIKEMELSICKKESIKLRNLGKSKKQIQYNAFVKKMQTLNNTVKKNTKECRSVKKSLIAQEANVQQLNDNLLLLNNEYNDLNQARNKLYHEYFDSKFLQRININIISILQKECKDIEKIKAVHTDKLRSAVAITNDLNKQRDTFQQLLKIINDLANENEYHSKWFQLLVNHCHQIGNPNFLNISSQENNDHQNRM